MNDLLQKVEEKFEKQNQTLQDLKSCQESILSFIMKDNQPQKLTPLSTRAAQKVEQKFFPSTNNLRNSLVQERPKTSKKEEDKQSQRKKDDERKKQIEEQRKLVEEKKQKELLIKKEKQDQKMKELAEKKQKEQEKIRLEKERKEKELLQKKDMKLNKVQKNVNQDLKTVKNNIYEKDKKIGRIESIITNEESIGEKESILDIIDSIKSPEETVKSEEKIKLEQIQVEEFEDLPEESPIEEIKIDTEEDQKKILKKQKYTQMIESIKQQDHTRSDIRPFHLQNSTHVVLHLLDEDMLELFFQFIDTRGEAHFNIIDPLFHIFRILMTKYDQKMNFQELQNWIKSYFQINEYLDLASQIINYNPSFLTIKEKIKIQKILQQFQEIKNFKLYEDLDNFCGVVQFFVADVCKYVGILVDHSKNNGENVGNFNAQKLEYYEDKLNAL